MKPIKIKPMFFAKDKVLFPLKEESLQYPIQYNKGLVEKIDKADEPEPEPEVDIVEIKKTN